MDTIKIWSDNPSDSQLAEIASVLQGGGVIIYPTDTVYALGCDALNPKAVEAICRIKGLNPAKNNLSIVCADISQAAEYARIDNAVYKLMKENTPGPVTFLLKALNSLPKAFKGRKIVGVRIPDCQTARAIVQKLGQPLLTTSIALDDDDYSQNPELIGEAYESRAEVLFDGGEGQTKLTTV
ncbi:MAG: threonylcarbamoyl-AMP synthase, partial [Muribaculaceae bacterium]|nr:threonylcarbamoyl-AMP synthase [Muribaculaceae bacterium]